MTSPKAQDKAKEGKLPRVWINAARAKRLGEYEVISAYSKAASKSEIDQEYLSITEHLEALAAAEREGRLLGARDVYQAQLWDAVHADSPAATYWAEKVDEVDAEIEAARASRGEEQL